MSTKTRKRSKVEYWFLVSPKTKKVHTCFITSDSVNVPFYLSEDTQWECLTIGYKYGAIGNTWDYDESTRSLRKRKVSRTKFIDHVVEIEKKYKMEISIRTTWGTNASQSSDT